MRHRGFHRGSRYDRLLTERSSVRPSALTASRVRSESQACRYSSIRGAKTFLSQSFREALSGHSSRAFESNSLPITSPRHMAASTRGATGLPGLASTSSGYGALSQACCGRACLGSCCGLSKASPKQLRPHGAKVRQYLLFSVRHVSVCRHVWLACYQLGCQTCGMWLGSVKSARDWAPGAFAWTTWSRFSTTQAQMHCIKASCVGPVLATSVDSSLALTACARMHAHWSAKTTMQPTQHNKNHRQCFRVYVRKQRGARSEKSAQPSWACTRRQARQT